MTNRQRVFIIDPQTRVGGKALSELAALIAARDPDCVLDKKVLDDPSVYIPETVFNKNLLAPITMSHFSCQMK